MVDLETRELVYFVAVAEELHFGRAAERLSIAQPALSKAIRRLETRLGVQLLLRNSRSVSLTPAGSVLLEKGRIALDAVSAASELARRAGHQKAKLHLAVKPDVDATLLSAVLAAYADTPEAVEVKVVLTGNTDCAAYLRDGRADVALLYAPFDDLTGLATETLYIEGRVAVLPATHRMASRAEMRLADLAGEAMPWWKGMPEGATGPEIAELGQLVQLVTLGRAIAVLPRSLMDPAPPGLVCIPVIDAPTSRLVIAWSRATRSPHAAKFAAAAVHAVSGTVRESTKDRALPA